MITVCRSIIKYKPKNPSSFLKPRVTPTTTKSPFITPALLSPKIGARVWRVLFNRYTLAVILICFGLKKMARTKSGKKSTTPATKSLKRKTPETSSIEIPVDVGSEDEFSDFGEGSQLKKVKIEDGVRDEFKERYANKDIGSRTILLGKPVRGSFLKDSGALEILESLGMSSFFTELPKICYPGLVRCFYGNLHVNDKGQFVSFVKGVKIPLNSVMLNSMLGVGIESLSVYSKRGPVVVDNFDEIAQLKMILIDKDVVEFALPKTSKVLPLAHLLFRLCIANVCPRLGTRSNFSCQDLVVVAMMMAGRKFNLGDLVLNNMLEVVEGSATAGLPYGLLLSRLFDFFGVDNSGEEQVVAKDFFDVKGFGACGLSISKAGELVQAEIATPTSPSKTGTSGTKNITEEEQLAFMAEVRAFMVKMEEDSAKFCKVVEKGFAEMAARKAPAMEYDKVAAIVQKVLEDAELSEGDAAKTKDDSSIKPGGASKQAEVTKDA